MAMKAFEDHTYTVCGATDGTLGYSDGGRYRPLYGRLQQVSEIVGVKVTTSLQNTTSFGAGAGEEFFVGLKTKQTGTIKTTFFMENVLFKYEADDNKSGFEAVYVQEEWKKSYAVRPLLANALRGTGAMLESNKGRVYVLGSSIPHENQRVARGYLKVDGSDMVEHFLLQMRWASRCEGIQTTWSEKAGEYVPTFVIKDRTRAPDTVGYYVVCSKSCVSDRVICHLEPIGWLRDALRSAAWHTGDTDLGVWGSRVHGAQSFLFD